MSNQSSGGRKFRERDLHRFSVDNPMATDSLKAMRDFAHSDLCSWDIDLSRFNRPLSLQHFWIPDVDSVIKLLCVPWVGFALDPALALIDGLHEATVLGLKVTPLWRDRPSFVPVAYHIYTDGSYMPGRCGNDGDLSEPKSSWAFVVLAEDVDGNYVVVGAVSDYISIEEGIDNDVASRHVGLTHHSALGAEYCADMFAILWVLQHPDKHLQFHIHGDCLCPLMAAQGLHTWSSEPIPHIAASLTMAVQNLAWIHFHHVKKSRLASLE